MFAASRHSRRSVARYLKAGQMTSCLLGAPSFHGGVTVPNASPRYAEGRASCRYQRAAGSLSMPTSPQPRRSRCRRQIISSAASRRRIGFPTSGAGASRQVTSARKLKIEVIGDMSSVACSHAHDAPSANICAGRRCRRQYLRVHAGRISDMARSEVMSGEIFVRAALRREPPRPPLPLSVRRAGKCHEIRAAPTLLKEPSPASS